MTEKERIAERLRRLKILATQGVNAGERNAAQRLFEKLAREYDFDLLNLDDSEEAKKCEFKFSGKEEEKILLQTIAKVLNTAKFLTWQKRNYNGRIIAGLLVAECTREQEAEIKFLFDFYKELWKGEKEKMLSAFIQKHGIAPSSGDGKELSPAELQDLFRRMNALDEANPYLRLESAV